MRPPKPKVKRRPYGTGTVEARWIDGRWQFRARYPDGEGGRHELGMFDDEERAHGECNNRHAARQVVVVQSGSVAFCNYGERVLDRSKDKNKASWKSVFNTVISRADFFDSALDEIERPLIKRWVNGLDEHVSDKTGEPISWQTQKHALGRVKHIFQEAVEEGLIKVNPAAGIKMKKRRGRVRFEFLSIEQIAAVFALLTDLRDRAVYALAIYVGMRQGEIAALDWRNVHLGNGPHAMVVASWDDDTTKTDQHRRATIIPIAREILHAYWVSLGCPVAGLLFPSGARRHRAKEKVLARGHDFEWSDQLDRRRGVHLLGIRRRAGIPRRVWFHHLRHTCASQLLMGNYGARWTLKEVGDLLGHSSETMTERYGHLSTESMDDLAARTTIAPQSPRDVSREDCDAVEKPLESKAETILRAVRDSNPRPSAPEAEDGLGNHSLIGLDGAMAGRFEVLIAPDILADLESFIASGSTDLERAQELAVRMVTSRPVKAALALGNADAGNVVQRAKAALESLRLSAAAKAPKLSALLTPRNAHRFWSKVDKSGAHWLWTGPVQHGVHGPRYGRACFGREVVPAHRFAWAVDRGAPDDSDVIVQCNEPLCVWPEHLKRESHGFGRRGRRAEA